MRTNGEGKDKTEGSGEEESRADILEESKNEKMMTRRINKDERCFSRNRMSKDSSKIVMKKQLDQKSGRKEQEKNE